MELVREGRTKKWERNFAYLILGIDYSLCDLSLLFWLRVYALLFQLNQRDGPRICAASI